MKAYGTNAVSYLKGRDSTSVFYGEPRRKYSIIRKYVIPRLTANNTLRGLEMKNLGKVWRETASGYKEDGVTYMLRYNQQHPPLNEDVQNPNNFFSMFLKAMHAWQTATPLTVDLTTLTVADMGTAVLETIGQLIDAGYLPAVNPYTDLDQTVA